MEELTITKKEIAGMIRKNIKIISSGGGQISSAFVGLGGVENATDEIFVYIKKVLMTHGINKLAK